MRVQEGSSKIILIVAVRFRACIRKGDLGSEEWLDGIGGRSVLRWVKRQTGAQWQAVLADAERLLTGEALLPYWRLRDHAGLNLAGNIADFID